MWLKTQDARVFCVTNVNKTRREALLAADPVVFWIKTIKLKQLQNWNKNTEEEPTAENQIPYFHIAILTVTLKSVSC